jgi:hypothetical protein
MMPSPIRGSCSSPSMMPTQASAGLSTPRR